MKFSDAGFIEKKNFLFSSVASVLSFKKFLTVRCQCFSVVTFYFSEH